MQGKKKKKWIAAVAAVCVVAVAAGLLAFFAGEDGNTAETVDFTLHAEDYRRGTEQEGFSKVTADVMLTAGSSALTYAAETGDFTVTTDGGRYVSSLSEAADTDRAKLLQSSLVYIEYFDKNNTLLTMSSRKDALKNGGVELYTKDNTLRVLYTLGKNDRNYFLPLVVRASVFDEDILPKLEGADARKLKKYYRRYEVGEKLTATEKNQLLKQYPGYRENDIYVYIGGDSVKLQSSFEPLFKKAGFNEDAYAEELRALSAADAQVEKPAQFFLAVEFTLSEERLCARVINDSIAVSDEALRLVNIHLLPCFGSSTAETGYMVLPDGGGSYVDLSLADAADTSYSKRVYGKDVSLEAVDQVAEDKLPSIRQQEIVVPSYIFSSGTGSYCATAVDGAEYATVSAKVKGQSHPVNTANFSFSYRPYQIVETGNTEQMVTLVTCSAAPVKSDFTVLYQLTGSPEQDAPTLTAELKKLYGELGYIGKDTGINASDTLFVDMYCLAVDDVTGETDVLSTFADIESLLVTLKDKGIKNCILTLKAISGDGLDFSCKNQLKPSPKLGGIKGLQELLSTAEKLGYCVNLAFDMSAVYTDGLFDGFSSIRDGVKNVEQLVIRRNEGYLLSPDRYPDALSYANKTLHKLGSAMGVTLENGGLNSELNKKKERLREDVAERIAEIRDQLKQERRVIVSHPYLPFRTDIVTDLVLNSSQSAIQASEFPLVAALYNQNTLYSGQSINLAADPVAYTRTVCASGAALKVSWMIAGDTVLMNSQYSNRLYSLCYKNHINSLVETYHAYNGTPSAGSVQFPAKN